MHEIQARRQWYVKTRSSLNIDETCENSSKPVLDGLIAGLHYKAVEELQVQRSNLSIIVRELIATR